MQLVALPLFLLLTLALAVLVSAAVRAGRPGHRVTVPADLILSAEALRRRAGARAFVVTCTTLGTLCAGVAAGLALGWERLAWSAAFLTAAAAGSAVVLLVGPPHEPAPRLVRSADLTPRTPRGFGPRWAFTVPSVLVVAFALTALLTASSATRAEGRSVLAWSTHSISGWVSPYPGWADSLPLLGLLLAAGSVFAFALRRVAGWPRPVDQGLHELDDDVRRATTRMLLLVTTGALLGALAAFGSAVSWAWASALGNRRVAVQEMVGQQMVDPPSGIETLWQSLEVAGALLILASLALVVAGGLAGRVRRPHVADARARAGSPEAVG